MSKKKIDPSGVLNELKESSSFFRPAQMHRLPTPHPPLPASLKTLSKMKKTTVSDRQSKSTAPGVDEVAKPAVSPPAAVAPTSFYSLDTATSRYRDTEPDTTVSRYHDTIIERTRRAVKFLGKEAATYRF